MQGFKCIRSKVITGEETRGGTAVLFKNNIWEKVYDVRRLKDQIWFKLDNIKHFIFGAIYIPPRDSPFFSHDSFASIHEMITEDDFNTIILGDFNARIKDLDCFNDQSLSISYVTNIDTGTNSNGKDLKNLCNVHCLKPVNNMVYRDKTFNGNFTFKQGNSWISQIDWAFVSKSAIDCIVDFVVLNNVSLPTDHAPLQLKISHPTFQIDELVQRATQLGSTVLPAYLSKTRPVRMENIDKQKFMDIIPSVETFWNEFPSVDVLSNALSETLYNTAEETEVLSLHSENTNLVSCQARWIKILQNNDPRQLWQSINWNGTFSCPNDVLCQPSDEAFCEHYQDLLNPDGINLDYQPVRPKYVPLLDDPIAPREVDDCLRQLKANKAAGIDGTAPGLLKLLPDSWILILTYLFNCVFFGDYPSSWTITKVFNIYKKRVRLDPSNYRGISILASLAKLYDMILGQRFKVWHRPCYEQAGAQRNRGCTEQIMTLRLLIDIARKKKRVLYILFIDYKKAYDKVNRRKLLEYLDSKGCGSTFLAALKSSYVMTKGQIGQCNFTSTSGVRQGACTSCPLFTFFIEPTIQAISELGPDGWLGDCHSLLLMDDTVILATSRERMAAKLRALKMCVDDIGMIINPIKTQYMSVNSTNFEPFQAGNVSVKNTTSYTYLGTPISVAPIAEQVKQHLQQKTGHVLKFHSFLRKNFDAPYVVKKTVWNSALKSAVFYSCETWFTLDVKAAETIFNSTLKNLLGVRSTTTNDLALIESGEIGAKGYIQKLQNSFIHKLIAREQYDSSYLQTVISEAIRTQCPAGKVLQHLMNNNFNTEHYYEVIRQRVQSSTSTRRMSYRVVNPDLKVHPAYTNLNVPEHDRIAFSKMRLSSHHMKFETGRWSRIAPENRLCVCGTIQSDTHVLLDCPLTLTARVTHQIPDCRSLSELYDDVPVLDICRYCRDVIKTERLK